MKIKSRSLSIFVIFRTGQSVAIRDKRPTELIILLTQLILSVHYGFCTVPKRSFEKIDHLKYEVRFLNR